MADSTAPRTVARATNGQGSSQGSHKVTPNPGGWFDVLSARSGRTHRVIPTPQSPGVVGGASCTCEWFSRNPRATKPCSHVTAVIAFARRTVAPPPQGDGFLTEQQAAEVQASTRHAFDRIERRQQDAQRSTVLTWPARTPAAPTAVAPATQPGPALPEAPRSSRGEAHVHQGAPDVDCYCQFGVELL